MNLTPEKLQHILEAALMVAGRPLTIADLGKLFDEADEVANQDIRSALDAITAQFAEHSIQLCEVASGFHFQAKAEYSQWLSRLWEERAPRYSRAVLETIALIAYRQPITRAEIEEVRGVAVSSHIIKTLQEREWIKVVGHRDLPGKPALFATTKTLLDHLNLKNLSDLPELAEVMDLDSQEEKLHVQLELQPSQSDALSEMSDLAEDDEPVSMAETNELAENEVRFSDSMDEEE